MDQRRFLAFFTISMLIWIGWIHFAVPFFFPVPVKPPAVVKEEVDPTKDSETKPSAEKADPDAEIKPVISLPTHPVKSVWVGPRKDETDADKLAEFFLAAKFRSDGASIDAIELTDIKRYPAFGHRDHRLSLVGNDVLTDRRTFGMKIPVIDKQLKDDTLDKIAWEITGETDDSVTFSIKSPDGVWEVSKKFKLRKLTTELRKHSDIGNTLAAGYKVALTVTLKNLSSDPQEISYSLQGPTGIPLEDADNAYKHRDIRMGFLRDDGSAVDDSKVSASEVVKKEKANTTVIWKRPLKYIGVDVAYFATLVLPVEDQITKRTLDSSKAVVVTENKAATQYSDISVDLVSTTLTIPAKESVQHEYELYAGPKRQQLLQQVFAGAVLDYGWFDSICRGMVWVLNQFHSLGLSYGLAIICLTVVVRTMLIPLSKHQAKHAAKMKELQPKIQARQKELEARHGKNTEEYIKASQELVAEQSKMMLGGCLPMFLQLPIFIALYRSLSSSIELRMEPFLWFENLASPDALFALPFKVPFLGWTEFNLLPCISIGLMMVHQKLTMPPAQNEEQAAQYKMMNVMMFVMGATFYRVPAGLCLYFIATNIWSMTERTIFERKAKALALNPPPPPPVTVTSKNAEPPKPSAWVEWLKRLQAAADKDVSIRRDRSNDDDKGNGKNGKKKGKR
ncbi:MAG: membrane protein insertase YidC [Planctomycetes bacterium]|nr:membrane protein insertase YidC [Planctomycetota bacterium]